MRELIDRLGVADSGAAGALRVIDHFDRLVEAGAAPTALVRAAAALAGCPAGLTTQAEPSPAGSRPTVERSRRT